MHESNPYQAPSSALENHNQDRVGGSLQGALAGDFSWNIGDVIKEAWQLQSGAKLPLWGGMILYYLVLLAASFVMGMLLSMVPEGIMTAIVTQVVVGLVSWPMMAGLAMMSIYRAAGLPIRATMVFDYYPRTLPIFLLTLLTTLAIVIGMMLLVLPGIYLSIALCLALPLLIDKHLDTGGAMKTSVKVANKCWFQMFGLFLVMGVLLTLSMIPLGIGLIWTLPMMMLTYGIIYREMFGVNETGSDSAES